MTTDERLDKLERELLELKNTKHNEVHARAFILEDENGEVRAILAISKNQPVLSLFDENKKLRVGLAVNSGNASLVLFEKNGRPGASLAVGNESTFVLFDEKKVPRLALTYKKGPDESDSMGIVLSDKTGKIRSGLFLSKDGEPFSVGNPTPTEIPS